MGAQVYRETCASCHDAGVARAPQRLLLQDMTPEAIHRALTTGAMRPQAEALSAEQKVAVSEYVAGRKLGSSNASASLKLCTGAAARFDLLDDGQGIFAPGIVAGDHQEVRGPGGSLPH